jgi:predicted transcriptional regulator
MPTPTLPLSAPLPAPRLLAAARVLAGLSQRELAATAGIGTSTIARYEAGLSGLRGVTFQRILDALRKHGIRFVDSTDEIEMGVVALRGSARQAGEARAKLKRKTQR